MKIEGLRLRQRDSTTCGPSVAVVAGALLDPAYRSRADGLAAELVRRRAVASPQRGEPRLAADARHHPDGACPRAHRPHRGARCPVSVAVVPWSTRSADRCAGLRRTTAGRLRCWSAGSIPRHWVLIVGVNGETLRCYEPSSGDVRPANVDALRHSQLTGLGYRRPFAFVLPSSKAATRSATT